MPLHPAIQCTAGCSLCSRAWHHNMCHRDRWIKGDLTLRDPSKGDQVTLLGAAGAAAGKTYEFGGSHWALK